MAARRFVLFNASSLIFITAHVWSLHQTRISVAYALTQACNSQSTVADSHSRHYVGR